MAKLVVMMSVIGDTASGSLVHRFHMPYLEIWPWLSRFQRVAGCKTILLGANGFPSRDAVVPQELEKSRSAISVTGMLLGRLVDLAVTLVIAAGLLRRSPTTTGSIFGYCRF